jgi:hypothetical protein
LKLTLAAVAAKVEGNNAAADETSCSVEKDGVGERKRMGSDAVSVASRNGSVVDVDVDAVVGALAEVGVGE